MQVLGRLSELNKVTLVRIPEHQEIAGNHEAHRLAKEGTTEVPPSQITAIPFSVTKKKIIKKRLELEHHARWAACTGCRQSKMLMRYPLPSRATELLARSKLWFRSAVGLLIGHTTLRAHQ
jgi:hypothetical protein